MIELPSCPHGNLPGDCPEGCRPSVEEGQIFIGDDVEDSRALWKVNRALRNALSDLLQHGENDDGLMVLFEHAREVIRVLNSLGERVILESGAEGKRPQSWERLVKRMSEWPVMLPAHVSERTKVIQEFMELPLGDSALFKIKKAGGGPPAKEGSAQSVARLIIIHMEGLRYSGILTLPKFAQNNWEDWWNLAEALLNQSPKFRNHFIPTAWDEEPENHHHSSGGKEGGNSKQGKNARMRSKLKPAFKSLCPDE